MTQPKGMAAIVEFQSAQKGTFLTVFRPTNMLADTHIRFA